MEMHIPLLHSNLPLKHGDGNVKFEPPNSKYKKIEMIN